MPKKTKEERAAENKKNGKLGGRPKIAIDYDALKKYCQIHCTGEECASLLEIDYDTLNNHLIDDGHGGFSEYFKRHSANGKASLRRRQFKAAMDGNTTMLIWMGKQYLEQSDKSETKNENTDTINIGVDPSELLTDYLSTIKKNKTKPTSK